MVLRFPGLNQYYWTSPLAWKLPISVFFARYIKVIQFWFHLTCENTQLKFHMWYIFENNWKSCPFYNPRTWGREIIGSVCKTKLIARYHSRWNIMKEKQIEKTSILKIKKNTSVKVKDDNNKRTLMETW